MTAENTGNEATAALRRRLLARLLSDGVPSGTPERAPRPAELPASAAQQRLWFLDQLDGADISYNVPFAIRLTGAVQVAALHGALQDAVNRHESLRTVLAAASDGSVRQEVLEDWQLSLPVVPITPSGLTGTLREAARRPFVLAGEPLLRAALYRLADHEHVLFLNLHHAITDGWSEQLLFDELAELYAARTEQRAADLPELGVQYADFALQEAERSERGGYESDLAHWERELAHPLPAFSWPEEAWPEDSWGEPAFSRDGAALRFDIPEALAGRLRGLAAESGASVFMVLLSALAVLVHRQAGPDEVVVGVPVANREDAKWHGTYGLFVNTVAVRVSLAGYPTFREVLDRTGRAAMQALAHQEAPFDQVVARVVRTRSGDSNPVFQVACVLADRPWRLDLPGVAAEFLHVSTGAVKYPLKLSLVREEQGITAEFEYSTGLFSPEAVSWMASAYLNILHQLVDSPNRAVEAFVLEEGTL